MEEDLTNDVEAVEYIDSQDEDDPDGNEKRPIMLLLRRLIRNKQNTVMTNAQIIDILQSEFNISVMSSHELEVDIYIKIIKKYLKDWPQWEELERISTKLSNIKDYEAVSKVLDHKYKNLKEYLGVMLEAAKPLAKDAVKSVSVAPESTKTDNIDSRDVVMEIQCTREQLNKLFFRYPRSDLNNTVFNMSNIPPSRISLKKLSYKDILNGWSLKIFINLPHFIFARELTYQFKHVLVNRVRNDDYTNITLDTQLKMLSNNNKRKGYSKDELMELFADILIECMRQSFQLYEVVLAVFNVLRTELDGMLGTYKLPVNLKRYANKYKYVRYLYAESENNDETQSAKYDLQLEEMISPMYYYYVGKIGKLQRPLPQDWLKVECIFCKVKLPGCMTSLLETLESHFNECHGNEIDWQCTNCKRYFSIDHLTQKKWQHEC